MAHGLVLQNDTLDPPALLGDWLDERGIAFEEVDIGDDPAFRQRMFDLAGQWTVPLVVVDDRPLGGFRELLQLARSGRLDELVAA